MAKKSAATKTGTKAARKPAAKPTATTTKRAPKSAAAEAKTQPKATKAKAATAAKGAAKKPAKRSAGVKLNDKQRELLVRIGSAGESGYQAGQKMEERSIKALQDRKLVKRGPKNKETGSYSYHITKTGEKQLKGDASATATS